MQLTFAVVLGAAFAVGAASATAVHGFGPGGCVSLSRSALGSCVLHTNCGGQDLTGFDFSFDCVSPKAGRATHSLGIGTFDQQEEYDTDLKCQQCLPPQEAAAAAPRTGVSLAAISVSRQMADKSSHLTAMKSHKGKEPLPKAQWYGPENCVAVWRDESSGTCVMETDCADDIQLNIYEFGLICVDKDEKMTRHLFGMGSFGHKEAFNTKITCAKCLALDEYMDSDKAIGKLAKSVKTIKTDLKDVSGDVAQLNSAVFSPAPAQSPAAAPAPAQPTKLFLQPKAEEGEDTVPQQMPLPQQPVAHLQQQSSREKPQPHHPQQTKLSRSSHARKPQSAAQPQQPNMGKDITRVSDNGQQVQHVKRRASQIARAGTAAPRHASVKAILAVATQTAMQRAEIPKSVGNRVAEAAIQAPAAVQQTDDSQQEQDSQQDDDEDSSEQDDE